MSEDAIAVIGTRRTMRELVDGTIRVQVDVDPQYRNIFLQHFPLDAAVAIVPVKAGPAPNTPQREPEHPASQSDGGAGKGKPGPLCLLAAQWCAEHRFHRWLATDHNEMWHAGAEVNTKAGGIDWDAAAAFAVRNLCEVRSRKEFDHDADAARRFHALIREPYMAYMKEHAE